MNIALVIYRYAKNYGGVERYVYGLSRGLTDQGHNVTVFYAKGDPIQKRGLSFRKVPVVSFYSPLKWYTFAKNSKEMLDSVSYDLIHGFGRTYNQDLYRVGGGSHRAYLKNMYEYGCYGPWKKTFKQINPRTKMILHLEERTFSEQNYRYMTAISEQCKREVQHYYDVPDRRIEIIYNGVDLSEFHPDNREAFRTEIRQKHDADPDDFVVLFVGSGFLRKGLPYLLEGIGQMDTPPQLWVAGNGDISGYSGKATSLGIDDQTLFLGAKDQIERYYAAADVFVLPSVYEPFGTVVLEAMASGLPVLVSNEAGASEIITNGEEGYSLDPPSDTDQICQRIHEIRDEGKAEEMGDAARQTAEQYSIEKNRQKTIEAYEKTISLKQNGSLSH